MNLIETTQAWKPLGTPWFIVEFMGHPQIVMEENNVSKRIARNDRHADCGLLQTSRDCDPG
jgi:hypothetical protein